MNKFRFILIITLGACFIGQSTWASKAYVTDSFEITLRTGPSIDNKIIAMPYSGQPVEVIESEGDWSHVRLLGRGENSVEGWLLSRYLVTRLPWKTQAATLKRENVWFKEELVRVKKELREVVGREEGLKEELQHSTGALGRLRRKYESLKQEATDYLKLKAAYDETRSSLEVSQKAVETLTKENERLSSSQRNIWFATGALVLLCGLLIGILVGRQQKKRRSLYS